MSIEVLSDSREMESRSVVDQLQVDEQRRFLPFGLAVYALFGLGYAVWHHQLGEPEFAFILGVTGSLSVLFLVLYQLGGERFLQPIKALFCLQIMAMSYLFILFCKVGQTGLIGSLCMVPGIVVLCGKRVASWLLAGNLIAMAAIYKGWLFGGVDTYTDDMWVAFLGAYAGLGLFVVVIDHLRDCSREKLVAMTQQFDRIAALDQLTGLPNRKELERLLGNCLNSYHLSKDEFSIILGDVDNFKQTNEQFGTQFGDQLLQVIGKTLQQGLRSDDMAARWGGDQFLILLRGQKKESAMQVAERLRRSVAIQKLAAKGEQVGATVSFGVATIKGNESGDELIAAAERGLYQAKHMGKDMVVFG